MILSNDFEYNRYLSSIDYYLILCNTHEYVNEYCAMHTGNHVIIRGMNVSIHSIALGKLKYTIQLQCKLQKWKRFHVVLSKIVRILLNSVNCR